MTDKSTDKSIDMIYDLMKEDRKETNDFRKEIRDTHTEICVRLTSIEVLDAEQNKHLSEHIRRTDLLENLWKENEKRISNLERPIEIVSNKTELLEATAKDTEKRITNLERPVQTIITLKQWVIGFFTAAGAIIGLCKLLGLF